MPGQLKTRAPFAHRAILVAAPAHVLVTPAWIWMLTKTIARVRFGRSLAYSKGNVAQMHIIKLQNSTNT